MFAHKTTGFHQHDAPVAKRGNLVFVRNGYVYIISIELAEKALEGSSFSKTVAEEDALLRTRLLGFLGKITFTVPLPAPATDVKSPVPAPSADAPTKEH